MEGVGSEGWSTPPPRGSAGTITIRSTRIRYGTTTDTSTPKTARGTGRSRSVRRRSALKAWKRTQTAERLLVGPAGRTPSGSWSRRRRVCPEPEAFSNLFRKLAAPAGLPPIRLHDLRHSYATAALAAGVPVKVVSQRIGHADVGVTLAVYAHVMPGDDEDAAPRADALLAEP